MKNQILENQVKIVDQYKYGAIAFFMVFGSCLGSIAAMFILKNSESIILLALCTVASMMTNALCIAQASGKACLYMFYAALGIDLFIILLETFV